MTQNIITSDEFGKDWGEGYILVGFGDVGVSGGLNLTDYDSNGIATSASATISNNVKAVPQYRRLILHEFGQAMGANENIVCSDPSIFDASTNFTTYQDIDRKILTVLYGMDPGTYSPPLLSKIN